MSEQNRQAKVLRIGLIQDGKVQEERLVETGEDVTVGSAKGATFVVPDAKLDAPQMTLFAFRDGRYQLQFDNVVKGKVSVEGKPVSLDKVRKGEVPAGKAGELWALPLKDTDKGKLKVGNTTILFQFVPPPPISAAAAAGKVSFRPKLIQDDDPVFFGFLALWSALGAVFMVWVYNTEVPETTFDEIPDRFKRIVVADVKPPPETPKEDKKPDDAMTGPDKKAVAAGKPSESTAKPKDKPAEKGTADRAEQVKAAEQDLVESNALLAAAQAVMIGTTGAKSKNTVLRENAQGDFSNIDAQLAKAAEAGAVVGDGSRIKGGTIGGTGVREQEGGVAVGEGGTVEVAAKAEVKAPKGRVGGGDVTFDGGDASGVLAIVRRYEGQLNYCYEKALRANPNLGGRVLVSWYVEGERATDVTIEDNGTGDSEFGSCIASKIRAWQFRGVDDGFAKRPFIFQREE